MNNHTEQPSTVAAPVLATIGVVVSDTAASLTFYRRLGLDFRTPSPDGHVEAPLGDGRRFTLDTDEIMRSFDAGWVPASGPGQINLGFRCDSPRAVQAVYADLIAAGYRRQLEPFDAFWGERWATVRDPDGNRVDLYAPLPTRDGSGPEPEPTERP